MGGVSLAEEPLQKGETQVFIYNNTAKDKYKLRVTLISNSCWDAVNPNWGAGWEDYHPTTTQYDYSNELSTDSTSTENNGHIGIDMCFSSDGFDSPLGLGKYRIEVVKEISLNDYEEVATFTLDCRTSGYSEHNEDISFNYYVDKDELKINGNSRLASNETVWGLTNNRIPHETDQLQPYPPSSLLIVNQNQWNSNPVLLWSHSSESDYWTGYNVYRSGPTGSYVRIAELPKYANSYTDQNTVISEAGQNIHYYVKAVHYSKLSDPSSIVSIVGSIQNKNGSNAKNLTFYLKQNYPNPFNPMTTISYSIPSEELVTLRVYDNIGKEVKELVNENQKAGEYSINFNGGNLSSGLYIYKITAGLYSDTKKLLLIK